MEPASSLDGPNCTPCLSSLPIWVISYCGGGRKPPPAMTFERSAADMPAVAFRLVVAVASLKLTSYTRAIPRLLPQFWPPAVAEGWLVPKKVVPAIVTDDPIVFSPERSLIIHPLPLSKSACACVICELEQAVSCRQSLVASNRSASVIGAVGLTVAGLTSTNLRSLNM